MTLHRLLGFRSSVPDPDGLAAFYGELGLHRESDTWTGSDGGATVTVAEEIGRASCRERVLVTV